MSFPLARRLVALAACAAFVAGASAQTGDIKERNIKLSYVTAKDSPYGLGVNKLAEIVAARSGGKMKLRGYSDGQLGAVLEEEGADTRGVGTDALVAVDGIPLTERTRLTADLNGDANHFANPLSGACRTWQCCENHCESQ